MSSIPVPVLELPVGLDFNPRLDRWVCINADGTVTVRTGKVEIGQGIVSAMAQLAADELDVAYGRIRMVAVDTTLSPNEGSTSGSRSIEEGGTSMRQACAEVRDAFLQRAAQKLNATLESLAVDDGTIYVRGDRRTLTYWELAAEVDLARDATGQVRTKSSEDLKLVGRALPRVDIAGKLTGRAYVHDLELPAMLHGRVVRPPSYRAQLARVDATSVEAMPGVRKVVRAANFLGVVAVREEQAIKAMQALVRLAQWEERADLPDADALPAFLLAQATEDETVSEKFTAHKAVTRSFAATYTRPYLAHASIGPSCAVAQWHEDRLEVWSHSQAIYPLRDELVKILKIDAAKITVRHMEGAGCYGHNGADDAAFDAVLLAREAEGSPVRVQWMREDEFGWEPYGPAMVVKLEAALDERGNIVEWKHDQWGNRHVSRPGRHPNPGLLAAWHLDPQCEPPPATDVPLAAGGASQRNAVPYYDFPSQRVMNHVVKAAPLRTSTLRALGAYANVFAIESFMDELAQAAQIDPVEFRLRHLNDERAQAVIRAVVEKAQWKPGQAGDGERGIGLAFARYKNAGAYVATIAEVVVEEEIRVPRVVAAVDCGRVVNPDGVINQVEGGIVQATSWTLKEQVRFDRTRITSRTWEDYPILKFGETPKVEVALLDRPNEPSLGVGEAMAGPTAAAIANAVFNALGVRVRDLPFTRERLMAAINS